MVEGVGDRRRARVMVMMMVIIRDDDDDLSALFVSQAVGRRIRCRCHLFQTLGHHGVRFERAALPLTPLARPI